MEFRSARLFKEIKQKSSSRSLTSVHSSIPPVAVSQKSSGELE